MVDDRIRTDHQHDLGLQHVHHRIGHGARADAFQQGGQKGTMIGTEGYCAPEQYKGDVTTLSDIYSLGATLHHVLTRKDPRLEAVQASVRALGLA